MDGKLVKLGPLPSSAYKKAEKKIEYKPIKKAKQFKPVLKVNLKTYDVTLNGVKEPLNKAPFKTFAGIYVPMSIIKKMFSVKELKDGYEIKRRL